MNNSTTGTDRLHDRNGHDTTTGTAVPPTLQVPPNHQRVLPDWGTSPAAALTHTDRPPSRFCDRHPHGTRDDCGGCANARTAFVEWQAQSAAVDVAIATADDLARRQRRQMIDSCPDCDDFGRLDDLTSCEHPNIPKAVGYG